jgi:hypothetical protein
MCRKDSCRRSKKEAWGCLEELVLRDVDGLVRVAVLAEEPSTVVNFGWGCFVVRPKETASRRIFSGTREIGARGS